jgi:3',5'-cyclic AMP phosphodiesterase CpdA
MIIAQVTDTHIAHDAPDAARRASDLERTIADINALDPAPDAVIHTGDLVHGGRRADYALAASLLGMARAPVFVTAGNRDDRENLRRAFARLPWPAAGSGFLDYAIEDFSVRLIAVDSLSASSNKGDFSSERARRLMELIDAETTKPIAVFMHHPPFVVTVGPDPVNFVTPEAMAGVQRALQHSGRVAAVFCGHVHRSTAGRIGTVAVMVAPCTATTLRKGEYPPHMRGRPVYHLHRFDPTCGFVTQARIVAAAGTDDGAAREAAHETPRFARR